MLPGELVAVYMVADVTLPQNSSYIMTNESYVYSIYVPPLNLTGVQPPLPQPYTLNLQP